jgi:sRNA-binding protein
VQESIAELCRLFPEVFKQDWYQRQPLKIGIRHDILERAPGAFEPKRLSAALRVYCANQLYVQRIAWGRWRIDLDGKPVERAKKAARRQAKANLAARARNREQPASTEGGTAPLYPPADIEVSSRCIKG